MCQPHARRKDLEAPSYVVSEWQHNGNKNLMADILQRVNWDKDNELLTWLNCILDAKIKVFEHCLRIECSLVNYWLDAFCNEILIIVKKKKTFQLTIDEGWYSEEDLKELGWNQCNS